MMKSNPLTGGGGVSGGGVLMNASNYHSGGACGGGSGGGGVGVPSSASSSALKDSLADGRNKNFEEWIGTFLYEIREGKSSRSGSGGGGGGGGGGSGVIGSGIGSLSGGDIKDGADCGLGAGSSGSSGGHHLDEWSRKRKAIHDLHQHLQNEMPEMSDEQKKHFFDYTTTKIFDLMTATNMADIKSGIIMMCILLDAPQASKHKPTICAPFANHLRNVNINGNDLELLDLISCAVGKIALYSGPLTPNFVEFEVGRAVEAISNERADTMKRHSAILNLRELANITPTFFFNHMKLFFEYIFVAINDSKLREPAISCLRAALNVAVDRERIGSRSSLVSSNRTTTTGNGNNQNSNNQNSNSSNQANRSLSIASSASSSSRIDSTIPKCFELCFDEVMKGLNFDKSINESSGGGSSSSSSGKQFAKDREDRIHASLLILNELLRCSHDTSVILRDSISREMDFLYINQQDFNDHNSFYLTNYLYSHFDYPLLSTNAAAWSTTASCCGGGPLSSAASLGLAGIGFLSGPGNLAANSIAASAAVSVIGTSGAGSGPGSGSSSSSSSNHSVTAATASAVSAAYRSTNYLTKILRQYSCAHTQSIVPQSYSLMQRDLRSVVSYRKVAASREAGDGGAPVVSYIKRRKSTTLSNSCRQLVITHFADITQQIIAQIRQKNSLQINQVLLLVLPCLVSLEVAKFAGTDHRNVSRSIEYLLTCVKAPQLKSLAFISLGLFALAIKSDDNDDDDDDDDDDEDRHQTDRNPDHHRSKRTSGAASVSFDQHLPTIMLHIRQSFPATAIGRDGQQLLLLPPPHQSQQHSQPHHHHHHHHHHHQSSKKRGAASTTMPDPTVFTCLAFLAQAVKGRIREDIGEMLPAMLLLGLTEPLANSLHDICRYIPELRKDVHEGLLRMLAQIVMDKQLIFPKSLSDNPLIAQVAYPPNETFDLPTIRLALKVLGRFDFATQYLMHFIRYCADFYLVHESRDIRLEAVHTCCRLLRSFMRAANVTELVIRDVLGKLILVSITDMDRYVRYSVLSQLDEQFDYYLAQAENLQMLQLCLSDEMFEIRELGVCIMGRLCALNPAYVMPFLRKILLSLLTELEISGVSKNMENAARMLGHLLAATPRLVRPYTEPILKVFMPKLTDPSQAVSIAVMSAIGDQAIVSGLEMRSWFYQLLPIILDAVQDNSSLPKREIALWTMGRLIENCGLVVEPYWRCPNLLQILFNILRAESTKQSQMIRRETLRVMGLLGAVDPYRHKIQLGVIDLSGESLISVDPREITDDISEMLANLSNNFDEYYSAQAISTLIKVMQDPNASAHHTMAVQAIVFIFNVLKMRSVPYIPQILPPFIQIIRLGEIRVKEFLLQQLGQIIQMVGKHIRVYLDEIFKVLRELWTSGEQMQLTLFSVIESIVLALGGEFRNYVPHLVPHIMKVLTANNGSKDVMLKLFGALQNFGSNLEDYIHMLIPPIVRQFESPLRRDAEIRMAALKTIDALCDDLPMTDFSSRIIHSIVRTIDANPHDKKMVQAAVDTLIKLCYELRERFNVFIPLIGKVFDKYKLKFANYDMLVKNVQDGVDLDDFNIENLLISSSARRKEAARRLREKSEAHQSPTTDSNSRVSLEEMRKHWARGSKRISKEDWLEWLRKFSIDLVKESPSLALRSCYPIAQASNTVARDLFNPAFLTCWNELKSEQEQKNVIDALQEALKEQEIPEVTGTLLNLAEFLEHIDNPDRGHNLMMFDVAVLGERAMRCRAYAKALHYKEKEFASGATTEVLGALITINNKLQQSQAAYGVLRYALRSRKMNEIELKEKWFEKLNNWESAFIAHKLKYEQNNADTEAILGQMRCLEVLSEWENLHKLAADTFPVADDASRQRMARMAVNASWNLNKWDDMAGYTAHIAPDSSDFAFYQAVLRVHDEHYTDAQLLIDQARMLIDTELTTMVNESHDRAYPAILQVQLMSELEEVIQYRLVPERRGMIKEKWWQRLLGCQGLVEDWKKILQVHSLVLSKRENMRSWLKFAKLCDRNHRPDLSFSTIVNLMGVPPAKLFKRRQPLPMTYPEVTLKFIDHLWHASQYKRSFIELNRFISTLENPLYLHGGGGATGSGGSGVGGILGTPGYSSGITYARIGSHSHNSSSGVFNHHNNLDELYAFNHRHNSRKHRHNSSHTSESINKVLSRAYLKMAECCESLVGFSDRSIQPILDHYQKATERDKNWYKAWHSWAFTNFRALKYCKERQPELKNNLELPAFASDSNGSSSGVLNPKLFCIQAVHGFFRSVMLSQESSLQDTLRILTLWFEDGYDDQVRAAVEEGIKNVPVETWLQVIPQLIARIDIKYPSVAKLIHQLLTDIGKYHPQALIYPLTVASKSQTKARSLAANNIFHLMRVHSPNLVKEAVLVSEELIRCAVLWHEMWHEGLEEASRQYFGDHNIPGMFNTLEPLHNIIEKPPMTIIESQFNQHYGAELAKAHSYCKKYKASPDPKWLKTAWEMYYHCFRRIARQIPTLMCLELPHVSPMLLDCTDLELAVPGPYNPNKPLIGIAKVEAQMTVISSKQRPRKLTIRGSDGRNYMFLLKGHEDLRQDERIMQMFGLVNTLLNAENSTSKQNLAIQRYGITPLAPNSGLIGWVPQCDTLHSLIRDYRDKRKILLNMEHRLMLRMAPDYDRLTLMQKVEVFEHALEHTPGDDLAKILWLKSPSSEVWFERRTNYTRSLAVMSMVGYVLGLGDRHPSNLMLDRKSGKILHIDFGDCFEVAMIREKYPEKIPFRLTRMLINAMEVTGLDGTYTITCQSVMMVMRKHKESLMALLEAFVYDPLLGWRLVTMEAKTKPLNTHHQQQHHQPPHTNINNNNNNNNNNNQANTINANNNNNQTTAASALQAAGATTSNTTAAATTSSAAATTSNNANNNNNNMPADHPPPLHVQAPAPKDVLIVGHQERPYVNRFENPEAEAEAAAAAAAENGENGLNTKAVALITRVRDKLTGRDFDFAGKQLVMYQQVDRLIKQATSHENLCQCYIGWCPFW